jgi:group II intron reverse transcriptase/maturase
MNLSVMDKDSSQQLLLPGFQKELEQGKESNHRGSLKGRMPESIGGGTETSFSERPGNPSERIQEEPPRSDGRKEKGRKVHSLIDKVYSRKNLEMAWERVKANKGVGGTDGVSIERFEANKEKYLDELHQALKEDRYRPTPVRRVWIPKPDGRQRPLGIPTIKDRVVQQALLNRLGPIFEKKFLPTSFGFRPGRSTHDALRRVWIKLREGYLWIVDADIEGCFDTIPHERLIDFVAEEISDGRVLRLIRMFLKAGVMEGIKVLPTPAGTPQGGVISPLLANIYLHPYDLRMRERGYEVTRYADDFIVQCRNRREAEQALGETKRIIEGELGLTLHPTKTRLVHVYQGIEFLGYKIGKGRGLQHKETPKFNLYAIPMQKSVDGFKEQVRKVTQRKNPSTLTDVIGELNPVIRGWGNYYRKAHVRRLFHRLDGWIERRIYSFIAKRWRNIAWRKYPTGRLRGEYGLVSLFHLIPKVPSVPVKATS